MSRGTLGKLAHCREFRGVVRGGKALEEGGHWEEDIRFREAASEVSEVRGVSESDSWVISLILYS